MATSWGMGQEPELPGITPMGWIRIICRGLPLAALVFGCLVLLLLVRLVEKPLCGLRRPVTPHIARFVCRNAFRIIGMRFLVTGTPMQEPGAVVANHTSWLDIFALNATKRIYFVSKSEVAGWPGIGWLARSTGTLFIERNPAHAKKQTNLLRDRLLAGHKLLFFPEGTSSDGSQVLPFKTTLFEAFLNEDLRDLIAVQPVSVYYDAPPDRAPWFYGWWGDMSFASHLLATLAPGHQGGVRVHYHTPLHVREFADRKALARAAEEAVQKGHRAMATKQP